MQVKEVLELFKNKEFGKEFVMEYVIENMSYYNFTLKYVNTSNGKILDAGCGYGYGTYYLSIKTESNIVGIDIDENKINLSKKNHDNTNLKYYVLDLLDDNCVNKFISTEGDFDLITCFEVLEHIPKDKEEMFLNNLKKLLKSDGILILSTPNKDVWDIFAYTEGHINEKTPEALIALLRNYFEVKEVYGSIFIPRLFYKFVWKFGMVARIDDKNNELRFRQELIRKIVRVIVQPSDILKTLFRKFKKEWYYQRLLLESEPDKFKSGNGKYPEIILCVLGRR
jgi:2-polyprenyl-3-methyl-5-hydroxy-6-metoxy-1,4-benzoquinol methylase